MKTFDPNIEEINKYLIGKGIKAIKILHNSKSSESYIRVEFEFDDGEKWDAVIPYVYRRSGLNLTSETDIADYLVSVKPYFRRDARESWRRKEWAKWKSTMDAAKDPESLVTINFFKTLLSFKEEINNFPANSNPQRRFQDIKDKGYTVAIYPIGNRQYGKMLLPIPLYEEMGYETFTPQFKARVIRLLKGINAFEAKQTPIRALIPDHKFSEVRWDEDTKGENPDSMTDEEIIKKFQLLDNQRNQQKREICRKCFQTGKRGKIFGIDYYVQGTDTWDSSIPTTGKDAEKGCLGCPWYDIEEWRRNINELIKNIQ